MTIRANLVRAALRTGLELTRAKGEHKQARRGLTDDERWAVDMAIPRAVLNWYDAGEPEGGPEAYIEEALAEAEARVSLSRRARTEPRR